MKILFFGKLKDVTGKKEIDVKGIKSLYDLKEFLFEKYPFLKNEIFLIAINSEIAPDNVELNEGDEIALLPPISGG